MRRVVFPLIVAFLLWQGAAMALDLPAYILPTPFAVLAELWTSRALIAAHAGTTLAETLAGLVLGTAGGVAAAMTLYLWPRLRRAVDPLLAASQAVPVFVLAPLLTIWLGYGMGPKIAMTVLLVFFPVLSNLSDALDSVPEAHLDLARIARASRGRTLFLLCLPQAMGGLATGMKIAATYAPTGAVIGEWIGASKGLGYLMLMANARSDTTLMFAALLVVIALTLALRSLMGWLFSSGARGPASDGTGRGQAARHR